MDYNTNPGFRYPTAEHDRFEIFRSGTYHRDDLGLARLENLEGWDIAEGEPDIRGWDIVGRDDDNIARVETLIASPKTQHVYFIVAQAGGVLGIGGKHVLVPLSHVHIDRVIAQVHVDATRDVLENAVEWRSDTDIDYVDAWRYWERGGVATIGAERELAGVAGGEAPAVGETRIPLREEEVHVTKRPAVKEEIVVRQHPETEVERRTETVRREVAEVHREGEGDVEARGDVEIEGERRTGRERRGT